MGLHHQGLQYRYVVAETTTGSYVGYFNDVNEAETFAHAYAIRWEEEVIVLDWGRRRFREVAPT